MTAFPLVRLDEAAQLHTIDTATLGNRIRAARAARGLSQADIAAPLITPAYLSRIESGDRRPSVTVLAHLAAHLGMPVGDLVHGVDHPDGTATRLTYLAERAARATALWLREPTNTVAFAAMTAAVAEWEHAQPKDPTA